MPNLQKKLREIFQECWLDDYGETSEIYESDLEEKVLAVFYEELGLVAQQIRDWIKDKNLKDWVKRELLDVDVMKMYGCTEDDIDGEAIEIANGIQVFLRKEVWGLLVEDSKEKQK